MRKLISYTGWAGFKKQLGPQQTLYLKRVDTVSLITIYVPINSEDEFEYTLNRLDGCMIHGFYACTLAELTIMRNNTKKVPVANAMERERNFISSIHRPVEDLVLSCVDAHIPALSMVSGAPFQVI